MTHEDEGGGAQEKSRPEVVQVLILEDRPADAEMMVHELQKHGFNVDWKRVDTEPDFYAHLTPSLQVILADYSLPGFDAVQALENLRRRGLDIPLIVVSGTVDDNVGARCLAAGATDYLLKDRLARLGPAVEHALRDRADARERDEIRESLRLTEDQLQSLFNSAQDVVWSVEARDGSILYLNHAAETLFHRKVQEYLDDPDVWIRSIHPDDRERMAGEAERLVKWGTSGSEYRIVRPDGEVRHVEGRSWTQYDATGKPVRFEGIIRDVTEERRAAEQRREIEAGRQEADRLGRLNEFKSRFLNMVAHDLNNVLTPMRVNLRTLQTLPPTALGTVHQNALQRLDRGIVRLARFLADLLDAARLQSGKLTLVTNEVDLSTLVHEAVDEVRPQADAEGITLQDRVPDGLTATADAHRVAQVMANLLSNAVKFTPRDGLVHLGATKREGRVEFSVTDSGCGILPEEMPRLFEPFSRLEGPGPGKHTGTGLGLFICRGIVEQHGGTIDCQSPGRDRGSTFTVVLPLQAHGGAEETADPAGRTSGAGPGDAEE